MSMTTVSANVVDQDGTPWRRGSWSLEFIPNPDQPALNKYNIGGVALDPAVIRQAGHMDDTTAAAFSIQLYDNTTIVPIGSKWKLTVCPLASAQCGYYTFSASGSSIDISSALTFLIPVPRFIGEFGTYGYADIEVIPSKNPGSTYWDVINQAQKYYDDVLGQWVFGTNSGFVYFNSLVIVGNANNPILTLDWNQLTSGGFYFVEQPAYNSPPDTDRRSFFALIMADPTQFGGIVLQEAWNFNAPGNTWVRQYRADQGTWSTWRQYSMSSLLSTGALYSIYASNEAALAGGLAVGNLYRTGADPDVLCIVH